MTHALTKYREDNELTLEAFSKLVGASKGMVWKWENDKAIPSKEYMARIFDVTNRTVTALDWYGQSEAAE